MDSLEKSEQVGRLQRMQEVLWVPASPSLQKSSGQEAARIADRGILRR